MRSWILSSVRLCVVLLVGLLPAAGRPHDGVSYQKLRAAGVPIHLVTVDLNRKDLVIRPVVAPAGQRYTVGQFVKAHRPLAAVNGTFFDTLTGVTVGNLVSEGRLLSEGMTGSNLILRRDGGIELTSSRRNLGRYQDWSQASFAIGAGPTLLADGEYVLNPRGEGFSDPSLFRPRPRTAIGVTREGKLRMVVVTNGVTLWTLAHIMKDLGCHHALNLDGGSSSSMSVGGQTMVAPSRKLTNMVGVFTVDRDAKLGRALGIAQERASQHYARGQEFLALGWKLEARSQLRQAVAKGPDEPTYWRAAGIAEEAMANPAKAMADFQRAGELFLARGDLMAAEEAARRVLAFQPENLSANLICGEALVEQGRDGEAVTHLEAVLTASPGHPKAADLLEGIRYREKAQEALNSSGQSFEELCRAIKFG